MSKRPTVKEVAKAAGVSVTTVSYVINQQSGGNVRISDETRERVWRAVEDLDYRPNLAARHTRTGQSQLIGFISDEIASTPFAVSIIKGAQSEAWQHEKMLFVINTERDKQAEKGAIATLLERRVEGIIYATMYHRAVNPPENIRNVQPCYWTAFVRTIRCHPLPQTKSMGDRWRLKPCSKKGTVVLDLSTWISNGIIRRRRGVSLVTNAHSLVIASRFQKNLFAWAIQWLIRGMNTPET